MANDTARLVAEYRFAGDASDRSGHGRHGVVHGAVLTTDRFGRPNHAYYFDGVDDFIEVAPPPSISADAFSVSAWARYEPRDLHGWTNCIVSQDDGDDEDQSRRVFQVSTDQGHIVWHTMCRTRDPMCRRRVRPHTWYHVVAVHDGDLNHLYVDGALHDTVESVIHPHESQPLHIGRKGTAEPSFFFHGAIDDVRIHDGALTEEAVRALLRDGGWSGEASVSGNPGRDPLSGRWGQDGVVFLDLIYDGDRTVTGRIMGGVPSNMAPVGNGSFDVRTGTLRLEGRAVDPRHGGPVQYCIEGMLDDGEITVCARFNDYHGNFMLTRNGTRPRLTRRSLRSHVGALAFRARRLLRRR